MVRQSLGLWTGVSLPAEQNKGMSLQAIAQDCAAWFQREGVTTYALLPDHEMGSEGEEYEIQARCPVPPAEIEERGEHEYDTLCLIRREAGQLVCNLYTARAGIEEKIQLYQAVTGKIDKIISFEDTLEWLDN